MVKIKELFRQNKILFLILFFSFAVSVSYSFYFQIKPQVDARAYDTIAWNVAQGNGYRENLNVDISHDYAIARVGPLYEYMLAGVYAIFGHHYELIWILQAFLHSCTAYLIYLTALQIFKLNERKKMIGLIAAGVIGFYPDLIEIAAMLMIETTYLFLLVLTLYLFFRFFDRHNILSASALGVVSAATILSRPPVLFFLPIIIFYFIKTRQFILGSLFLLCFTISFIPWSARNYQIYGEAMPLGAAGSYNLWIGNHSGANGEQEQPLEAVEFIASHPIADLAKKSEIEFKNFIWHNPVEFIKLTLLRTNKYFSVARPMGFWFYQSGISQFVFLCFSALASIILFVVGLAGIFRVFKSNNIQLLYLLAFTIMTPLIILVTVVETRYRFQIYPLFAIFVGYFIISSQFQKIKFGLDKFLWASVSLIFINVLIDLSLSFDRIRERLDWFF